MSRSGPLGLRARGLLSQWCAACRQPRRRCRHDVRRVRSARWRLLGRARNPGGVADAPRHARDDRRLRGSPARACRPQTMIPRVTVARADLAAGLKLLAKFVRARMRASDVVLSWDGDGLALDAAGQSTVLPATGAWPGQVRVPARFLLAIAPRLPAGERLEIRVEAGRMYVNNVSVACTWDERGEQQIELPLDPPITLILSLAHRYSAEEIARSGNARLLRDAQDRRDRLAIRAADVLRPLGVTPDDVVGMINEVVARLHPKD